MFQTTHTSLNDDDATRCTYGPQLEGIDSAPRVRIDAGIDYRGDGEFVTRTALSMSLPQAQRLIEQLTAAVEQAEALVPQTVTPDEPPPPEAVEVTCSAGHMLRPDDSECAICAGDVPA